MLLKALAKITCPWQLKIVGGGKSEVELRDLVSRLQHDDRISFIWWVSHQEVPKLSRGMRCGDSVLLASTFRVNRARSCALRAAGCGLKCGGISDRCDNGKTGFTVPEEEMLAFAEAPERLLTDFELAQELGGNVLRQVKIQFSIEASIAKVKFHLRGDSHLWTSYKN